MSQTVPLAVILRLQGSQDGTPVLDGVFSAAEMPRMFDLRIRLNPDMRARLIHFPAGTTPLMVADAIDILSPQERTALYHRMSRTR